uniref:Uncharacterized protein n=1 Tax=Panagrolaimus sp. ES5 TaxID=591445 RepID=A0AC34G2H9_9BILA
MKLRSGKIISVPNVVRKPDVDMTDLTNDSIPSTSTDPKVINNSEMLSSNVALQPATLKYLNYKQFRDSALRQVFSLPASIMYYVAKNPPSAEVYQKMIQSCKYFFIKNPIIFLHCLHFSDRNRWKTCIDRTCYLDPSKNRRYRKINLNLDKIKSKIWIGFRINVGSKNAAIASSVIPKLYNGHVKKFALFYQKILFNELLFISKSMESCYLQESTVCYQNGNEVPYEITLSNLPQLKKIFYGRRNSFYDFSKTAAELLKIPHLKNLTDFVLAEISDSFDIDLFFKYLKQNTKTTIGLKFNGLLSFQYTEKLQAFTDEILEAEMPRAYLPPGICFEGQLRQNELRKLWEKYV